MVNETDIDFNKVLTYIKDNPKVIEISNVNHNFFSKITYHTGKVSKKIIHFIKAPETKASVLLANWAATATLLLLMMIASANIVTLSIIMFLFIIETYAVFGNIEYTLAYAKAKNYIKVA